MPYSDNFEYTQEIRDEIETTIVDFYGEGTTVLWYKENDPFNYEDKVDNTVVAMLRGNDTNLNMQIKRSSYPDTFSITKPAMTAYLNKKLPLSGLIVCLASDDNLYLFPWTHFIGLAQEMYKVWWAGTYYIIPIDDLLGTIPHVKMEIPKL